MTFAPVIPIGGMAGWRFLQRTAASQQAAFQRSPLSQRETKYFLENIHKVASASQLVADRTMFKVALGAFGLDDEASKKFFLQKVLSEGTDDAGAFANRLVDTRYRDFARAFGFGNFGGANTIRSGFGAQIVDEYNRRQFERAVGATNNDMRLAMTFKREIAALATSSSADGTAWFQVMGNPPLRRFFEQAFNLPAGIGALDIDRQREIFRAKNRDLFGTSSLSAMTSPANLDEITRRFFAFSAESTVPQATTPGYAALTFLRGNASFSANLVQSSF